jgi:hypothetical protein
MYQMCLHHNLFILRICMLVCASARRVVRAGCIAHLTEVRCLLLFHSNLPICLMSCVSRKDLDRLYIPIGHIEYLLFSVGTRLLHRHHRCVAQTIVMLS